MSAGSGFNIQDLNRLARTLAQGAEDLQGLSGSAPPMPDAGASSGAVGEGISALAGVMSKATQTAANAADQAQASHSTYNSTDQSSRDDLHKIRGSH